MGLCFPFSLFFFIKKNNTNHNKQIYMQSTTTTPTVLTIFKDKLIKVYTNCKFILDVIGIYFVWILLHYLSAHLYTNYCVPLTYVGFLSSPFIVPTPHCQAFRWLITNGSTHIMAMWVTVGSWLIKCVLVDHHHQPPPRSEQQQPQPQQHR